MVKFIVLAVILAGGYKLYQLWQAHKVALAAEEAEIQAALAAAKAKVSAVVADVEKKI
jgi:hypothetical protein